MFNKQYLENRKHVDYTYIQLLLLKLDLSGLMASKWASADATDWSSASESSDDEETAWLAAICSKMVRVMSSEMAVRGATIRISS